MVSKRSCLPSTFHKALVKQVSDIRHHPLRLQKTARDFLELLPSDLGFVWHHKLIEDS